MITESDVELENIRVQVRLRPFNQKERNLFVKRIISLNTAQTELHLSNPRIQTNKKYIFDRIFKETDTQAQVYNWVAYPIVQKTMEGYNGTIFAYGQTGTGKTYTMTGVPLETEKQGIIPKVFNQIFETISSAPEGIAYLISATYLEIYNEEIRDLLSDSTDVKLEIRERPDVGVYVKDLTGYSVDCLEAAVALMRKGNRNRIIRSTHMNDVSSRSHTIFTLNVESKDSVYGKIAKSKLNLVDLAGSERWNKSLTSGDCRRESININQSLFVLGNVISSLVDGKSKFIPYRNSKLTRLLQGSLGGNSKTTMIATISASERDYDETACTLRYACRVKSIKNQTCRNIGLQTGLIDGFEQEIVNLRKRLQLIELNEMQHRDNKKKPKNSYKEIRESELQIIHQYDIEKTNLLEKISDIQKKILVGTEDRQTYEDRVRELSITSQLLSDITVKEQQLEEHLYLVEEEQEEIQLNCTNLEAESDVISSKLESLRQALHSERALCTEKETEYQREIETVQFDNKLLIRELQLANFIIEKYVPKAYLETIKNYIVWDKESSDYRLLGVSHSGNNMRKRTSSGVNKNFERQMNGYRSYGITKPLSIPGSVNSRGTSTAKGNEILSAKRPRPKSAKVKY